jgi:SAM-dependent methyltransferase
VVDLGPQPPSNRYLTAAQLDTMEPFFPLTVRVCTTCWLVQLPAYHSPEEIFGDYAYFSSYSESWLAHCRRYADEAVLRYSLDAGRRVVEVASNDGYLLQFFAQRGVPVLGVEPAANVAAVAQARGIPTLVKFFGAETAEALRAAGQSADLLIGNNVLAHVPDLNDFIAGLAILLKPGGTVTLEFPHLMRLFAGNQFDTIYHEHFCYFSFLAAETAIERHGLKVADVEELSTHGGSLRLHAGHRDEDRAPTPRVAELRERERAAGYRDLAVYRGFGERVAGVKRRLLSFLIEARETGRQVVGYGAPAKGNTLLNYCGIREDLLAYTVDRSPHKQGKFLPGTHIPVFAPDRIGQTRPDYVLVLPWNIQDEVMSQMAAIREWGGRFVVPIPEVHVV